MWYIVGMDRSLFAGAATKRGARMDIAGRTVPLVVSLVSLCAAGGCLSTPRAAMRVDGRFDDWEGVRPLYVDQSGDCGDCGMDFGRVWIADDRDALYLSFETGREVSLQSGNDIVLYLDTDDSAETGAAVGGIGADISWHFGEKKGYLHRAPRTRQFNAYDVGLVSGPTVTSMRYEIKIRKEAGTPDLPSLFPSKRVRWLLRDEEDGAGDSAPDAEGGVLYELNESASAPVAARPMKKRSERDVPIVSNNVYEDNIFARKAEFSRILKALAPDILALQEIRRHEPDRVTALITEMLGGAWHMASHVDCFTLSRFPISRTMRVKSGIASLLDLPDETYSVDLFIVNVHFGSGTKEARRQREADEIVAMLRDVKTAGRAESLPPHTPIVIVGDLNLVGLARQLRTLLTGDIADEARFGPDSPPDWDGTPMTDLCPQHIAAPEVYTWMNYDRRGFGPGRIDYVIYADSALSVANCFVLSTDAMSDADLAASGLRRNDTAVASDHLPVVADLVL